MGEKIIKAASYRVVRNPATLSCVGLGSCVGIALRDGEARIGGLGHPMLPSYSEGRNKERPERYVDTSIHLILKEMENMGCRRSRISAKLVGGARMFSSMTNELLDIGRRNIMKAREVLRNEGITIVAEDVGGTRGRTIVFDVKTGQIQVKTMGLMLRQI